ncbi:MAG: hypothetical protein JW995_10550 [Melioribacteraceae bacterium]|nr:hypothetical protein [Melioribacteraceae bacterium]
MKIKVALICILFFSASLFCGCSDDDNPVTTVPKSVGTYEGTNSMNKPVSITIGNIGGDAWVTEYSIEYETTVQNSTLSGTLASENTDGIVRVNNNTFSIDLDQSGGTLTAAVEDNAVSGAFNFFVSVPLGGTTAVAGTFSTSKR